MHKKIRKWTAAFAVAAMLMQQCYMPVAAAGFETQTTETQTEETQTAETQAAESQTQAAETQAAESQTQAAETQAAESQTQTAETQATESQTQAAETQATESQTQAAETQATGSQTQAAETQAAESQTQAAETQATESQTQAEEVQAAEAETETETEIEIETETETERSSRVNNGGEVSLDALVNKLTGVLPYLFAAKTVNGPEDLLDGQPIADGTAGEALLAGLKSLSVELANAESSSEVEVINIYADDQGKLDTAQLEALFADQGIDVTKKYYVVNVIADSADQTLDFGGYTLKMSGQTLVYDDATQPCDIIYNFAAIDGDTYTAYKGTLKLSSGAGLQGTFLAPQATVEIGSALAGAVYAETVTVKASVPELMRVVFATGAPEEESETETGETADMEAESESAEAAVTEAESESAEAVGTEAESESADIAVAEAESEPAETAETEAESESAEVVGTEAESESAEATVPEMESESADMAGTEEKSGATETETELVIDLDVSETEMPAAVESETVTEAETTGTETASEAETAAENPSESGLLMLAEVGSYEESQLLEEPVQFTVALQEAESSEPVAGTVSVKTVDRILDAAGTVLREADAGVETCTLSEESAVFGENILYAGIYYLEISELPEGYQGTARIYFEVNEEGVSFESDAWDTQTQTLTVTIYKEASVENPVLTLTDESGAALSGAVFVLKDGEGAVLKDSNGYPQYYIDYEGIPVTLTGLESGTYILSQIKAADGYRIAEDVEFVVPETQEIAIVNQAIDSEKILQVTAKVLYEQIELTAEQETTYYAALFTGEGEARVRVTGVEELTFAEGESVSGTVLFEGLEAGIIYYVAATDEYGDLIGQAEEQTEPQTEETAETQTEETEEAQTENPTVDEVSVIFTEEETEKSEVLQYLYQTGFYPDGLFSYTASLSITLNVLGRDGKALETDETFYANLYSDGELSTPVNASPIEIAMGKSSSKTVTYSLKMTQAEADFSIVEVDSSGAAVITGSGFAYAVTYPDDGSGAFTVTCGTSASVRIQNKLNDSVVKISVTDASGKTLLSGATLAVKDSSGNVIQVSAVSDKTFRSGTSALVWTNALTDGETYYLTEITAPDGYTPSSDVEFTVEKGGTTEVVLENEAITSTGYTLTVSKQVYVGENQVYAYDTTSGTYAASGAYRFYVALFSDAKHTKKVSNVFSMDVSGFSGSVQFTDLKSGSTYYVAETDQYGVVKASSSSLTINYTDSGKVKMSSKSRTSVIQNVYTSLPDGYRYTGTLKITLNVTNSSGEAEKVTKTFYAGIYRNADYSDTPTIVKLDLQNASSVSVSRRILLSGSNDMTYYIAEVDENGTRITDDSDFSYTISIDQPTVTITKSGSQTVTITNKAKSSKATLYITKKVYNGIATEAVSETFYAGLFKDSSFTELYTDPIPLKLENASSLTLKLTLNLGSASGATIYIAEVDEDGNVIKNQRTFGYQIKIVNSTAEFTQDNLEIQTILLNSVYGTTSEDDWSTIASTDSDVSATGSTLNSNGTTSSDGTSVTSVATGDDTPLSMYVIRMGASLAVLGTVYRRRRMQRR